MLQALGINNCGKCLNIPFYYCLRLPDINNTDEVSFDRQYEKLCSVAPLLKDVVTVTAVNPKSDQRNIMKRSDTLIPSITSSASILLFSRNQSMNANASINSLLLRICRADKMYLAQFNSLHICVSHNCHAAKRVSLGKRLSVAHKTACKTIRRYSQRYD